ncbi:YfcE family phosphodiesterase [Alicyclobacillaceae bacterium I2511]|nr:YfcE family phosphodiesterase [Alicyclobacillaceae bacterium I2511]
MRLCVVSDTHRHRHELLTAVKSIQPLDAILHAGDESSDAQWLSTRVNWPIYGVAGNWDLVSVEYPLERVLDGGPRIFLTHGHMLKVKEGLDTLRQHAQDWGAQIAVYGHTHQANSIWDGNLLFLNPGSLSEPRGRRERTCALVEIFDNFAENAWDISVTHVTIYGHIAGSVLKVVLPRRVADSGT